MQNGDRVNINVNRGGAPGRRGGSTPGGCLVLAAIFAAGLMLGFICGVLV